jgi:DNA modification methylase
VAKLSLAKQGLRLVEEPKQIGYRKTVAELWTAQQRQMHSMHYVVSYRASFKPELPDFFIKKYSEKGAVVLDPFSGRGTTALQANLLGRVAFASDINPLSILLTKAKTSPAGLDEVVLKLNQIDFKRPVDMSGFTSELTPFYHSETYRELMNLRLFLKKNDDRVSNFIELLAISRLHGHSPGFFSVYSFPQISIPPKRQDLINRSRRQAPDYRAVAPRIIRKAAQALRDGFSSEFLSVASANMMQTSDARAMKFIPANSVDLVVTSPPFLDKVDYLADNWLEFWFAGINPLRFRENLIMCRSLDEWSSFVADFLKELLRVTKPKGYAVIEVGEVENSSGMIYLDEVVAKVAEKIVVSGKKFVIEEIMINQQNFTKLANCFRVDNNSKGTNTNRMVVLKVVNVKKPSSGKSRKIT